MVGHIPLEDVILVRVQVRQPNLDFQIPSDGQIAGDSAEGNTGAENDQKDLTKVL